MRCKTCHYSLLNLTGPPHRCPECGREFDPDDPWTTSTSFKECLSWRWALAFALVTMAFFFCLWHLFYDPNPLDPHDGGSLGDSAIFAFIGSLPLGCVFFLIYIVLTLAKYLRLR